MNNVTRFIVSLFLIVSLLSSALPCGPSYVTPLFDTSFAPEDPYTDFAAGRMGIIKPKFRRSVLFAAYRYIAGNGMNAAEQQAILDIWRGDLENKDFTNIAVETAVKAWVEKRKAVIGKEEKTPEIYAERTYGGYEFFPNCTKNAFETAVETLSDRTGSYGLEDPNVRDWVKAQDQVFENCASGKRTPDAVPSGSPQWLIKDRDYQLAAASFYSLDYEDAKRRFAAIAADIESSWAETADYLVARTLIRQASLSKASEKSAQLYDEAETHLQRFNSRSGKFSASAEGLMGLIKYRRHPKERVSELAKQLTYGSGNFRQDLIDYTWLLDKFENEVLTQEERRKAAESAANDARKGLPVNTVAENRVYNAATNSNGVTQGQKKNDDDITIHLSSEDYTQNWVIYVDRNATDDEAIAAAEKVVGAPLSDTMKQRVRDARRSGYTGRFSDGQQSGYEGGYYGDERLTPSLMPDYLRQDDMTDWLFTYQVPGAEAYLYSLSKFKSTGSEHWLMAAIAKAAANSTGLAGLLEAAERTSRTSPAYLTIAYHTARVLIAQGKKSEAKRLLEEMLSLGDQLPVSSRNSFLELRLTFAETLEDFISYSLRKPFAFDFDGQTGTIDEIIAEQKKWYDPETHPQGREAYEAEIEAQYKQEREWQGRLMFDEATIEVFNKHFPTSLLQQAMRSPAMPDYLRERFAIAIWTRAYLFQDPQLLARATTDLIKYYPDFEPYLTRIVSSRSPAARENAALYFLLKNPLLSPYVIDGMGKTDNEFGSFDSNDWWCEPYDSEYNNATDTVEPKPLPTRPTFLSPEQSQAGQLERKQLKEIGDAPKYLAGKVMEWAARNPTDARVPEAIYIMIEANGWTKYACGNNEELRAEMIKHLRKNYPDSAWTAKLDKEEAGN